MIRPLVAVKICDWRSIISAFCIASVTYNHRYMLMERTMGNENSGGEVMVTQVERDFLARVLTSAAVLLARKGAASRTAWDQRMQRLAGQVYDVAVDLQTGKEVRL